MEDWISILLPFALILARISGFFAVVPFFGGTQIPVRIRAGLTLMMTIFFALITSPGPATGNVGVVQASLMLTREIVCGAGLGMAARLVYMGVQQGGRIVGRQLGVMMASVIDPTTGERSQSLGILFDLSFMLLFMIAGGHHLLLIMFARSYEVLPMGTPPDMAALAEGIVSAGSMMLVFALKLAAPVLAAFLALGVTLAVLARVLPEMNLLLTSLPMRVGLGLFIAAAILPMLEGFTAELTEWMKRFLIA
ncbi:MAG: flagellar biosynthetic protein FliR [Planctomycetota bacterium]|jgi:flagellar biosynthetic protein FliR